ncbi:4613_t:CDS:1, partial [Racocetra persica]
KVAKKLSDDRGNGTNINAERRWFNVRKKKLSEDNCHKLSL